MKTIKEIMVHSPKSCTKHEPLHKVVKEMSDSKIGTIPVVDKDHKVIGIITDRDICLTIGRTNKHISDLRVQEAMTHEAHTCIPEDDVDKVYSIMRAKKVARLPVVDNDGRLHGIISLNTVLRQLHSDAMSDHVKENAKRHHIHSSSGSANGEHNSFMPPYDYEHWGYNEHWGE